MATFQRARTDEQRAARQAEILDAARAMLREMPLTDITLNALARRVGLATSNVLRYFESREAILLELVHAETTAWLDDLERRIASRVGPKRPLHDRAVALSGAFARAAAAHPDFCELISAQALILERKIGLATALEFKRTSSADLRRLCELIVRAVPELGAPQHGPAVARLAARATLLTGALWAQARATEALHEAFQAEPSLRPVRDDFPTATQDSFLTMLTGTLDLSERHSVIVDP